MPHPNWRSPLGRHHVTGLSARWLPVGTPCTCEPHTGTATRTAWETDIADRLLGHGVGKGRKGEICLFLIAISSANHHFTSSFLTCELAIIVSTNPTRTVLIKSCELCSGREYLLHCLHCSVILELNGGSRQSLNTVPLDSSALWSPGLRPGGLGSNLYTAPRLSDPKDTILPLLFITSSSLLGSNSSSHVTHIHKDFKWIYLSFPRCIYKEGLEQCWTYAIVVWFLLFYFPRLN